MTKGENTMSNKKRITGFVSLCFALFVWSTLASAGAPAPPPAAKGPHTPDHQIANLGEFQFESGEILRDFFKVNMASIGRFILLYRAPNVL